MTVTPIASTPSNDLPSSHSNPPTFSAGFPRSSAQLPTPIDIRESLKDKVKQAVGPEAFRKYLPDIKRIGGPSSNRYVATCPFHSDSHPSLSIEFKRDWVWYCHPCGTGGDVFDLVRKVTRADFPTALRTLASDLGISDEPLKPFDYDPAAAQRTLQESVTALDYLVRRGISPETAKAASLGLVDFPGLGPSVAIPYGSSGVVKLRALSPTSKDKKFRHLAGKPSADLLYGIEIAAERIEDDVFGDSEIHITESELDCLTMRQAGFNAVSVSSATTCLDHGTLKINPDHLAIVNKAERIFLWLDMDDAGNRCTEAWKNVLPTYKVFRPRWPYDKSNDNPGSKDVGELFTDGPEAFRETMQKLLNESLNRPPAVPLWRKLFKRKSEMDPSPMKFLVDGFVPEGVTFFGALSGSGKTWLCLSIAKAICTGQKFLGNLKVEQSNVLYLVPESGERSFRQRMDVMGIPDDDSFLCRTMGDGALKLDNLDLLSAVRTLKPVVFLDTAVRFNDSEDENNASQSARNMGNTIFNLMNAGAKAVVCVHHSAKSAANKDASLENSLRGSGDLGAMADAVYSLKVVDPAALRVRVENVKARDFEPRPAFEILGRPCIDDEGDFGLVAHIEEPQYSKQDGDKGKRFLDAITANPNASYADLEKLGIAVKSKLNRMAAKLGWRKVAGQPWVKITAGTEQTDNASLRLVA
jgi:hypothetical protein